MGIVLRTWCVLHDLNNRRSSTHSITEKRPLGFCITVSRIDFGTHLGTKKRARFTAGPFFNLNPLKT